MSGLWGLVGIIAVSTVLFNQILAYIHTLLGQSSYVHPSISMSFILLIVWVVLGVFTSILLFTLLSAMEDDSVEKASTHRQPGGHCPKKAAFRATRLTPTVFLVNEHSDIYDERPFIYVKTISSANALLILDTGCGGATDKPDIKVTSLREFLETCDVEDNEGKPLNVGGKMQYVVVLSHCHYDHIRRF